MYLSNLHIKDFRSLTDVQVSLDKNLSVLIGPNGSGKTNFLRSIYLCSQLFRMGEPRYNRLDSMVGSEHSLDATFLEDGKRTTLKSTIYTYTDDVADEKISSSERKWYAFDFTKSRKLIDMGSRDYRANYWWYFQDLLNNSDITRNQLSNIAANIDVPVDFLSMYSRVNTFMTGTKYYSASQFIDPSKCPVSVEIERDGRNYAHSVRPSGHAKFLHDLYNIRNSDSFEIFLNLIGRNGMDLIDHIEFKELPISSVEYKVRIGGEFQERTKEKILIIPQFSIGKNVLSPNQLSEGTFKAISLIFYLITDKSKLLLIEEPEVCVHHGLLHSIVELIEQYSLEKQIVISTHSDYILDFVDENSIYTVVRDDNMGTQINNLMRNLDLDDKKALKKYLSEVGSLGEYWKHGGF